MSNCTILTLIIYGIVGAIIYSHIPVKYKKYFLLVYSCALYLIWTSIEVVLAVLLEAILVWSLTKKSERAKSPKLCMWLGIFWVVASLGYYKYLISRFNISIGTFSLVVPLGVSYFSLKLISYDVDVCLGRKESDTLVDFLVYILFFPQFFCGPISKRDEIVPWLNQEKYAVDYMRVTILLCQGVFYKSVIADRLVSYVATITGSYESYSAMALWAASFFYVIELYCDFAGYSMVVIAIGEMFGFKIEENFCRPYFALTVRDFWNRWHISLGRWLRDYIYIPLGGNKKGILAKIRNVLIVYAVSGIWHGNSLNFLVWGLLNGLLVIASPRKIENTMLRILSTIGTFLCFVILQVIFRINSLNDSFSYLLKMFSGFRLGINEMVETVMPFSGDYSSVAKCIVILLFIISAFIMEYRDNKECASNKNFRIAFYTISILLFGVFSDSSFMYAVF